MIDFASNQKWQLFDKGQSKRQNDAETGAIFSQPLLILFKRDKN